MSLVFISYSHQNRKEVREVLKYLELVLQDTDYAIWVDEQRLKASEHWHDEIGKAISSSRLGVLLVTPDFLQSKYIRDHELPKLNERGVPITWVHLRQAPIRQQAFASCQAAHEAGEPVWAEGRSKTSREALIAQICENIRSLLVDHPQVSAGPAAVRPVQTPARIHRGSFPKTSGHLLGRDDFLSRLDTAWEDTAVHVVSLIAAGGIGKSALLDRWYDRMAADGFRGAERVFVWSFYGQGTEQQSSSDLFLEQALKWFDPTAALPPTSTERGQLLAQMVGGGRNLLILDGIEPLQASSGEGAERRLRDPGLTALLTGLAAANRGLCILTSRFQVSELAAFKRTAPVIRIPPLDAQAGAELLEVLQVSGGEPERRRLAERCGGHALTIDLLGRFLWNAFAGDIEAADTFFRSSELPAENLLSGPAQRVMDSYVQWFDREQPGGSIESRLLQLLGLFDRPASSAQIEALCRPPISGLSDGLDAVSTMQLRLAFARLGDAGLVRRQNVPGRRQSGRDEYVVDAHPLVRNYFAARLQSRAPEAWRAGHDRLFEHFSQQAEGEPRTAAELAPLYAAVHHGCLAGRHEDAFQTIYWPRIHRRDKGLAHKWLGSNAAEVEMISEFFEDRWSRPVPGLTDQTQARVLGIASSRLRAQGELSTALRLAKGSFEHYFKAWSDVAAAPPPAGTRRSDPPPQIQLSVQARHQAELLAFLGRLPEARQAAGVSVQYAGDARDPYAELIARNVAAWVEHQAGDLTAALAGHAQAEALYRDVGGPRTRLHTLWGYRYAEALIESGQWIEAQSRTADAIAWAYEDLGPQSRPEVQFTLGLLDLPLALMMQVLAECARSEATQSEPAPQCAEHLDLAMRKLKLASKREFEPLCALLEARFHRLRGDEAAARGHLADASAVARELGLQLLEADCCLEAAEQALRFRSPADARASLEQAAMLIQLTGYARRQSQLQRLQSASRSTVRR